MLQLDHQNIKGWKRLEGSCDLFLFLIHVHVMYVVLALATIILFYCVKKNQTTEVFSC